MIKPLKDDWDTLLLLHLDGANNSTVFVDSSLYNRTVKARSNSVISTAESVYGGSSVECDGSANTGLACGHSQDFTPNTDFILSFFVKTTQTGGCGLFHLHSVSGWVPGAWVMGINRYQSGGLDLFMRDYADAPMLRSYTQDHPVLNDGVWHYVAFRRIGNNWQLWIDELLVSQFVYSGTITNVPIGTFLAGLDAQDAWYLNGYLDEILFRRNTGLQIPSMRTKFAVPTGAFTSDANTSLLLHMDGTDGSTTFTDSSSYGSTCTAVSPAHLVTATKKFGTASGLFDGSTAGVTISSPGSQFTIGTQDFCQEAWVNFNALPTDDSFWSTNYNNSAVIIGGRAGGAENCSLMVKQTRIIFVIGDVEICGGYHGITTGQWYHVAAFRVSSVLYITINGVVVATKPNSTNIPAYSNVGVGHCPFPLGRVNGYMDEARFSVGVSRYTSTLTLPAMPNKFGINRIR